MPPLEQYRRKRREHDAEIDGKHCVQHAFEWRKPARAIFDDEICERDADFAYDDSSDEECPRSAPLVPGKREEHERIEKLAHGVQRCFTRGATLRGQALSDLVMPEIVH